MCFLYSTGYNIQVLSNSTHYYYIGTFKTFFDMPLQKKHVYRQRIAAMRDVLQEQNLDAVIVTHDDEYLSFELTKDCERLSFLTGFTGSAGYAVVTRSFDANALGHGIDGIGHDGSKFVAHVPNAVFIDGRYQVQVKEQVDQDIFQPFNYAKVKVQDWIKVVLPKKSVVGIDMNCVSYQEFLRIKSALSAADIDLVPTRENVVDLIWEGRPERISTKVEIYPDEYNGCPSPQKRHALANELRNRGLDATVICDPESICWLLNIRGRDRACLPVVNCRMVAYSNEALEWYISEDHFDDEMMSSLEAHFGHVDIFPENRFDEVLQRLCSSSSTVHADPDTVNAHILKTLYDGGANVVEGLGLCQMPKACKNPHEIAGEYQAHVKDGVALCRFFAWLDDLTRPDENQDPDNLARRVADADERSLADRAESYRKVEGDYIEPSFDTISALGSNAAMCHYNYDEVSEPRKLGHDSIYLIDSGAHYLDGTTDITRTVKVGSNVSEEIRRMFTLVLKAHISFATTVFPPGTSGMQLDAIARRPLWDYGLDYMHGTGHGVGHLLSVHEGPQVVSSHRSTIPLEVGMIISNEPGYYKEGQYGIRLENLMVVQQCTQPGLSHMLCFQPLTMVPFDTRLVLVDMLTLKEKEWLNNYHQNVLNIIQNSNNTLTDTEMSWLIKATAPI